jgi:hypothetical protein
MAVLGLLPPYTLEDVKAAYRQKVMVAHPDRGGDAATFGRLQEAYERAMEYVTFRGDRRGWIAGQVDRHLRQQQVAAEVARRGGAVEIQQIDWLKHSFGEGFMLLAERLVAIRLRGPGGDDGFLAYLAEHREGVPYLADLDVANGPVTDGGLRRLAEVKSVRRLNLAGTAVTRRGLLALLGALEKLEWLNVGGTAVGWWSRWLLRRSHRRVELVAESLR